MSKPVLRASKNALGLPSEDSPKLKRERREEKKRKKEARKRRAKAAAPPPPPSPACAGAADLASPTAAPFALRPPRAYPYVETDEHCLRRIFTDPAKTGIARLAPLQLGVPLSPPLAPRDPDTGGRSLKFVNVRHGSTLTVRLA